MLKFAEPLGTGSHENRAGNAHFRIIQPLYQPHFQIIHPPCNPCTSNFEDFEKPRQIGRKMTFWLFD